MTREVFNKALIDGKTKAISRISMNDGTTYFNCEFQPRTKIQWTKETITFQYIFVNTNKIKRIVLHREDIKKIDFIKDN